MKKAGIFNSFIRRRNLSIKKKNIKQTNFIQITAGILIIICINVIGNFFYFRADLTTDKRYTLAPSTKKLLKEIEDVIHVKVYLEGDFPADFKRLKNETRDLLNQFRAYNKNIEYEFINPNEISDPTEQRSFYQRLVEKGIQPTQIHQSTKDGAKQILIFPAAEILYKEKSATAHLLLNQQYIPEEELLNNSIQNLEYTLTDAIRRVAVSNKRKIAFLRGHNDLPKEQLFDIQVTLSEYYHVENVEINEQINSLTGRTVDLKDSTQFQIKNKYDALIVTKPTTPFSDKDLFILDQFVMHGGKILWLISSLDITMDSLETNDEAMAMRYNLRLENILFRYGVRINSNLIMDMRNIPIPMNVGSIGGKAQISFVPWYYFPEIVPLSSHPIVKNLDVIKTEFASSIDTIESPVKKTVLLSSSEYSRVVNAPAVVSLQIAKEDPDERLFNKRHLPIAVLLEGSFTSAYRNRMAPELSESPEMGYLEESEPTKMIVVSDGNIIKNHYNYVKGYGYPTGYDLFTRKIYGNKDFILNCVNYLCDDDYYIGTRSREVKIRKLSALKIKDQQLTYQIINIAIPIILVSIFTIILGIVRKRIFTK